MAAPNDILAAILGNPEPEADDPRLAALAQLCDPLAPRRRAKAAAKTLAGRRRRSPLQHRTSVYLEPRIHRLLARCQYQLARRCGRHRPPSRSAVVNAILARLLAGDDDDTRALLADILADLLPPRP